MSNSSYFIKYLVLILLVVQNTTLVVYTRYSRVSHGPMYAASTAVAIAEVMKLAVCLIVIFFQKKGFVGFGRSMMEDIITQPLEIVKLSVPAFLYMAQNNLLYFALSNLDATTFQVVYQLKILTTALFAVSMLGTKLSAVQWISLVMLAIGVSVSQLSTSKVAESMDVSNFNPILGFISLVLAACSSGFSGIYFEKILKNSRPTLWTRNIQLGLPSILLSFVGIYLSGEFDSVVDKGFFYGYNQTVWIVVILHAVGGILVALVVKYADNILKAFAASFSIITSAILSYFVLGFVPTRLLILGGTLVSIAIYMYNKYNYEYMMEMISNEKLENENKNDLNIIKMEKSLSTSLDIEN